MTNEGLCSVCQAMLASNEAPGYHYNTGLPADYETFTHHPDGESFRKALDSDCRLCLQLWIELGSPHILYGTDWMVQTASSNVGHKSYDIVFQHDTPSPYVEQAYLFIQPYSEKTFYPSNDMYNPDSSTVRLSRHTGSNESLDFLITRYKECKNEHRKCPRIASLAYVPTRLLNMGTCEQHHVCLVNRDQVSPIAPYVSLSHCWGDVQPIKLTSESESTLRSGILISQLPKTFQHAIVVARRLDIKYIWIDSLCIFQDNTDDWNTEAADMESVYQNAALNVAATNATNSSIGLFYGRDPLALIPFEINIKWRLPHAKARTYVCSRVVKPRRAIDLAPLNRRAWVMQERHLSPRIVHFAKELLFWECCETFASELYPTSIPAFAMSSEYIDPGSLKRKLKTYESTAAPQNRHGLVSGLRKSLGMETRRIKYQASKEVSSLDQRTERPYNSILYAWSTFIGAYNNCQLTFASDKLVAVTGVAHRVAQHLNTELIAGLWRAYFIEELCWRAGISSTDRPQFGPRNWIAPSWSWASVDGVVSRNYLISNLTQSRDMAHVVELDVKTKPSGTLIDGHVKLNCRLVPALLVHKREDEDWKEQGLWYIYVRFCDTDPADLKIWIHLDRPYFLEEAYTLSNIHLLLLQVGIDSFSQTPMVAGLALVPSVRSSESESFERIGMFHGSYDAASQETSFYGVLMTKYEKAADRVVKII